MRVLPVSRGPCAFQFDHIIPQKLDGPTEADNLAWSCERCNSHKGALAAGYLDGKHIPLFNPRKDQWHDHFVWNGALLVGKTEIGEATIQVLAINLPYRVAVRTALILEGVFPPHDP